MSEIESLFAWDADSEPLPQMRERLRRNPRYPAAVRTLAANLLRDADEDPVLDAMLRDAGHNVAALSAIYLQVSGQVTLARLKTFIAGFGLVSPGRARSLLDYMRHRGYVEPDPTECSGRPAAYRVAPGFMASYARHSASVLDAIAVVEPAVGPLRRNLSAPGVFEALVTAQGDAFVAGSAQTRPFAAFYRVFLHPLAGIQLLHSLVAQAPAFPPGGEIAVSIPHTARRWRVSRTHVTRILKAAQAQGFAVCEAGKLSFTPAALEAIDWLYASRLCLNLACAAQVLKANPHLAACAAE